MPDDNPNQGVALWPSPAFRFEVDFGTELKGAVFQEVAGLEAETRVVEFRHGDGQVFSDARMPGIAATGYVTMKKGLFANDDAFWAWMNNIKANNIKRGTVTITLLDDAGKVAMQWTLKNAWPNRITGTDVKSDRNAVAVEAVEVVHGGMAASNP